MATLLHHRRYKTAARFMDDSYQYRHPHRSDLRTYGIRSFNDYPRVLDEYRKQRLKLNRYSVVADLVKEGATLPRLAFRKLFDADMLLFLRPLILKPDGHVSWYPRLIAYSESAVAMDVFARATTSKGLAAVRELFGVRDAKELALRMLAAFQNRNLTQFLQSERFRFRGSGFDAIVNWDELKRLLDTE